MRRGFWFVAGAGAGRLRDGPRPARGRGAHRRRAHATAASGLALGARLFRDEVAQGQAEKETELRERYGLVPHGTPELEAGRHRAVAGHRAPTDEGEGSN